MIDFTLPQKWLKPANRDHVLLVANRIAAIRCGDEYRRAPPEIRADGSVHFPLTNDHWLFPPTVDMGQPKGCWRLVGRYDSDEKLKKIVEELLRSLQRAEASDAVVRDCRPEDLPRFIELLKICGLFYAPVDSEATLRKKLEYDPTSLLVLESAGKVIGVVLTTYDPWASFVWHLAIDPAYQGRGLGNLLMDEAERRLRTRGTTSVNGYVRSDNRNSLSFFEKRGFERDPDQVIPIGKMLS